jgi:hypothetical protein
VTEQFKPIRFHNLTKATPAARWCGPSVDRCTTSNTATILHLLDCQHSAADAALTWLDGDPPHNKHTREIPINAKLRAVCKAFCTVTVCAQRTRLLTVHAALATCQLLCGTSQNKKNLCQSLHCCCCCCPTAAAANASVIAVVTACSWHAAVVCTIMHSAAFGA